MVTLEDIYEAYFDCRRHKRKTLNALFFEVDYESGLHTLWQQLNNRTYEIGKSICFVVKRPKPREVFAADFRDRIVHHYVVGKLLPLFEQTFITDSYSCRIGKSVVYGLGRLRDKIKAASNNYTTQLYVAKFDCRGFFMSINRQLLWNKLRTFIVEKYDGEDKDDILWLTEKIVLHRPQDNCVRKGRISDWDNLPKNKSLFTCDPDCGIAIGNLPSQIFANFFLSDFDNWMVERFNGLYGRYVDDFFVLAERKEYILESIKPMQDKLAEVGVTLHPNKIYIQPYQKGIKFTGGVCKYERVYLNKSTAHNFRECIKELNEIEDKEANADMALCRLNSYLGLCLPYASYGLRINIIKQLSKDWRPYIYLTGNCRKFVKRKQNNGTTIRKKRRLRSRKKVQREQVPHQL